MIWDVYFHGGLAVIYLGVMVYAADTLRFIHRARSRLIHDYARAFLLITAILAGTFAVIQGSWVMAEGYTFWPEPLDLMWLLFDSANALAYIAFVGATRVYLLWISSPCIDAPDSCPRKHH